MSSRPIMTNLSRAKYSYLVFASNAPPLSCSYCCSCPPQSCSDGKQGQSNCVTGSCDEERLSNEMSESQAEVDALRTRARALASEGDILGAADTLVNALYLIHREEGVTTKNQIPIVQQLQNLAVQKMTSGRPISLPIYSISLGSEPTKVIYLPTRHCWIGISILLSTAVREPSLRISRRMRARWTMNSSNPSS